LASGSSIAMLFPTPQAGTIAAIMVRMLLGAVTDL